MRMPARDDVTFHIVTEGTCWLRRDGTDAVQLLQGDMVLLPRGIVHDLVHHPAAEAEPMERVFARAAASKPEQPSVTLVCGVYKLDAGLARPMLRSIPPFVHFTASRVRANPALSSTLTLLTAELDRPGPGSDALVRHLFDALFVYVTREWADEAAVGGPGWLGALRDEPLSSALGQMHRSPGAPWTVASLARSAGLSRATFARRFTLHMGEPPLGYLTRWRMVLAAKMLTEGDASVAEVAKRAGYDSEFAFSRAFKRSRGVAPTGFRRRTHERAMLTDSAPEMAKEMGPDANREYVSLFDATGIIPKPRPPRGFR